MAYCCLAPDFLHVTEFMPVYHVVIRGDENKVLFLLQISTNHVLLHQNVLDLLKRLFESQFEELDVLEQVIVTHPFIFFNLASCFQTFYHECAIISWVSCTAHDFFVLSSYMSLIWTFFKTDLELLFSMQTFYVAQTP